MKKLIISMALTAMAITSYGDSVNKATTLLKDFEGFRSSVYVCEAGKKTIGYGFTSKDMVSKKHITEKEATEELNRLCNEIAVKLRKELGKSNTLTASEEAAVVSFIYNVGWANFKNSTMCRLLKEGKRGAIIGCEFHRWVYVTKDGKKVASKGLTSRRNKEARTFMLG